MEDAPVLEIRREDCIDLPPGFRFHPTDEEIITHYLLEKVLNSSFSATAVGEADLNKCEPWDLPKKAKMGEKEWFFFCLRDRKYPSGMRTNRATEAGYWKATGKDKEIYKGKGCLVGMKKTLVFYRGRAPKGEKTNWVMNEYRLEGKFSHHTLPNTAKEAWVVCKVFHKRTEVDSTNPVVVYNSPSSSQLLPPPADLLMDPSHCVNSNGPAGCSSILMRSIKDDNHDHQSTEFSYLAACINDSDRDDHQEDDKSLIVQTKTHNQVNNLSPHQIDVLMNPSCNFRGTSNSSYYCLPNQIKGSCNLSSVPSSELSTVVVTHHENKNLQLSSIQSKAVLSLPPDSVWGSSATAMAMMNTEISSFSGVSKQHRRRSSISYEEDVDVESASSSAPLLDLEFLWNY